MAAFSISISETLRELASGFFLECEGWAGTARRTLGITQGAHINLQLVDRPGQGVAVHAKLPGSPALIAVAFLKNGDDESLFEFSNSFRV